MIHNMGDFRSPVFIEPVLASGPSIMRTPLGNIRSHIQGPPPLPPPINTSTMQPFNNMGYGGYSGSYFGGGYGGFNTLGGFCGGYPGYGGYGTYNRFGSSYLNSNDPENQFIRIAEESSRPAFQSIESLVAAIGNIASMLDSTFFAITSTFRAILGVTANFGRLRGVFAQFWQTFAIFKGLTWIYKKLLYWLKLSNADPSAVAFREAYAAAQNQGFSQTQDVPLHKKSQSPWPVLAFLGFVFTAPYLIMKLLGNVTNSALEESRNPKTWVRPIRSQVIYDFQARNPNELSIRTGQTALVAPKEIQNTHKLLNTGWALATLDGLTSGLIPIAYVQGPNQMRKNLAPHVVNEVKELPKMDFDEPQTVETNVIPKASEQVPIKAQNNEGVLPTIPEASENDGAV